MPRKSKKVEVLATVAPEVSPVEVTPVEVSPVKLAHDAYVAALQSRAAFQRNAGNETQATKWDAEVKQISLPIIEKCIAMGVDFTSLAAQITICDAKNVDFLAVYAAQKVRKALTALAQGIARELDPYSFAIIENAIKLGNLSNKSAMVALSRSIEYTETEQTQAVIRKYDCSPSTASTQASSTRMMLRALNICNVVKNKQGDSISFKDNATAQALSALFA